MGYSDLKEMFNDAKNLATGANDLQLKNVLLEIQTAVYELQEENRDLRTELHEMKNDMLLSDELEYHNGVYTKDNAVYCAVCWDKDNKLSRARFVNYKDDGTKAFSCDVCNKWRFSDLKE